MVEASAMVTADAQQKDADNRRRLAPNQTMMAKRVKVGVICSFAPLSIIGLATDVVWVEGGWRACHYVVISAGTVTIEVDVII